MHGPMIVVEGSDGSGKGTQAKRALEALQARGAQATMFDFPQYDTTLSGALVGRALKGEFGDFRNMSPYLSSLPYTLDRVTAKKALEEALAYGYVICNRYTPSNAAHQTAKLSSKSERDAFITWLESLEYGELKLPKPDLVIYLRVPYELGQDLVKKKDVRAHLGQTQGLLDQHESDAVYMQSVIAMYEEIASTRTDWRIIECVRDGAMRSIDDIHEEVMELIDCVS